MAEATITQEEFDEALLKIVRDMKPDEFMAMPGIYAIVSEELNNEVIKAVLEERDDK